MVDVGGQRSERRKWQHAFDNVNAVVFVAAISGYDQALNEDRDANQMDEALQIFQDISNSPVFIGAALILFLNKLDLLQEKLQLGLSPIRKYYPNYTGHPKDVKAGQEYFAEKFKKLYRNREKPLYTHFTTAIDNTLLNKTMTSVQKMILEHNFNTFILANEDCL